MSHTTLAQGVSARHTIHVSCACVFDFSSTFHFVLFTVSPVFCFILLIFHFIFHVGRFGVKNSLCASANEESGPLVNSAPLKFSEVVRLFQSAGCVRNKLQFRTAQHHNYEPFHRGSGGEQLDPILFHQYQRWHSFSSIQYTMVVVE